MSRFLRIFLGASLAVFTIVNTWADPKPKGAVIHEYISKNAQGQIGVTEESPSDNPADNIFHVQIDQVFCSEENVWLEYELEGVEDHTSVARSINDHRAVGGHLVKKRRGWILQQERIDGTWLKQGDNVIRFTMPEGAQHNYRIRNLKISVTARPDENEAVIINQPSKNYYNNTAYVKGFFPENNRENIQLKLAGKLVPVFKGEFESEVAMLAPSCNVEMELIFPDGATQCKSIGFERMENADFHYAINSTIFYKEQFINQAKADSVLLQGASLKLVSGAFNNSSFLSITTLRDIDIPALDAGMINVTANHFGYRFLPHGTQFQKEGKLKIPFDGTKIPDGYTDKDIRTYFFDEQTHHWIALNSDTLLANTNEVVSRVTHFTDYINAIIKVPESPEVAAYNSTSMKGIKAANPTAGINLINPPQANNTGSASLSYPINIPAGRNGMQPQLGISYNSAGGNGWLGLGWNLTLPSIGIETRWGVPRYDPTNETETYTMNGDMLTPVAHREKLVVRSTDKQFYPRIEGAFHRIKRHGDSPSNYWWEVTDKGGTRYLYGGTAVGNKLDPQSVLRTDEGNTNSQGNVAHWALSEVIDLNGNFVKYHYAKIANKGFINGTVNGYQLYIDNITYTGHNGIEGLYKVQFIREQGRKDVMISANLGFKEVTADRLRKIDVLFNGNSVRSYVLEYKQGAFLKSLLTSVKELDAKGNFFNAHTFDYYDEVSSAKGYIPFKNSKTFDTFRDNINGGFLNKNADFNDNASILSGSKSTSLGAGLSVTLGPPGSLVSKTNSAGINYAYSHSSSEGRAQMIDINGDGLPDKVMVIKQGGSSIMKYRPQLKTGDGVVKFGEMRPVNGINEFLKEESNSNDFGIESHFGIFAGLNENLTKSTTSTYFTDANGDGLMDVVINRQVKFNRLDQNGDPSFSDDSNGTPNRLVTGGTLDGTLVTIDPNEIQKIKDQNPMLDVVRMWRAPFDGMIDVTAPVALAQDFSAARQAYTTADGVRTFVQLRDQILWRQDIGANDYTAKNPTGITGLMVKKNDRLYFRVNSIEDGSYDKVNWNPVIQYTQHNDTLFDANRKFIYKFNASEDYILASEQNVGMPINGKVMIESSFVKPVTSDSVFIEVIQVSGNTRTVLTTKKYGDQDEVNDPIGFALDVKQDDQLIFKVTTSSNLKWESIQWKPLIYYTASYDPNITQIQDDNGNPQIKVTAVPQYSVFAETLNNTATWKASQDDTVTIKPIVHFKKWISYFPNPTPMESLFLTVKKENQLMGKIKLSVFDTLIMKRSLDSLRVPVKKGEKLYFDYTTDSRVVAFNLSVSKVQLTPKKIKSQKADAGLFTVLDLHYNIFGLQYRGWGTFAYNGNDGRNDLPIDQGKLNMDNLGGPTIDLSTSTSATDMKSNFANAGGYQANKEVFSLMYANGNKQKWMGSDDQVFVHIDTLSSSRMGMDQISALFPELSQGGGTSFAVDKITKSDQTSLSVGAGGAGANGSFGNSRVITDYMDMNGDRYPDILGQHKIQYTLPQGGLEQSSRSTIFGDGHWTTTLAGGVSAGGGFPKSGKEANGAAKKAAFSAITQATSLNVSASWSKDDAQYSWLDVNGDGLPDRVNSQDGTVALNLGYSFTVAEPWSGFKIRKGDSESFSGGIGVNIADGSVQAGVGISRSDNTLSEALQDVNSDGLVDKVVTGSSGVLVYFGTGSGFDTNGVPWGGIPKLEKGAATSLSANAAFTFGIPLVPPTVVARILFNPHVSGSTSFNRQQMMLSDVDGDGFPDYLESNNDSELKVSNSTIGRTNLLRSVQRPLGASFTMNYHRVGNTYELPHSTWVIDAVKTFDGFAKDGADTLLTTFDYDKGIYDRHERDSYGFATVVTRTHDTQANNIVYTTVTQTFSNTNYYNKGLLLTETMTDGLGRKYVVKMNSYDLKDIQSGANIPPMNLNSDNGNAFPALTNTVQQFFEGQPTYGKITSTQYEYSPIGNVTKYIDNGDAGQEDDLVATIDYYDIDGNYIKGTPKSITVKNGSNDPVLRKREAVINTTTGEVTQIKQYLNDQNFAVNDMEYDGYGNLTKMTRPANSKGQRLSINYLYDASVSTYPVKVSNSYGYSSTADYDFRFGEKLSSTDLNGNKIIYTLDEVGRVAQIIGPYENGGGSTSNYTIKFQYFPNASVPYALTNHFDPQNPKNDLQTSIFVDGLGRVLQTKKDVEVFNGDGKADTEMMSVSGRVIFDALGRTVSAKYPITEAVGKPGDFNPAFDEIKPTVTTYDVMNRTLTVTLPDLAVTKTDYGFASDRDGKQQFSTKTTDANGKQTEQFTDVRGRVTSVKNYTSGNAVWTSFKYNAINEQIEATDDLKYTTFSTYDNFGRRTARKHPDAGITTYSYDLAGNLNTLVTANLAAASQAINYTYDFERLTQITYPQNPENNVKYTYGAAGASDNQAGRITLQEDATGAQEFFYGKLGEVVKNVRTVVIPQHDEQTFITQWTYDTWNRLTSMVYPDGETVTYNYNSGGLLHDMSGKKTSNNFAYVNQLGYDKFEQRVFLAYGNGTKTTYSYEDDRRRLKNMNAQTKGQRAFMDNLYTYDKVNNILDLKNSAPVPSANLMGGPSEYKYSYDDLYRLTNANGNYKGANDEESYTLAMSYNSVGSILTKNQKHLKKSVEEKKTTYNNTYKYGDAQPHAPIHIGKQTYTYDANGNQLGWKDDVSGQRRNIVWDEENRIRAIEDNGAYFHYVYNASGERVLKGQSSGQRIFVNGQWKGGSGGMGNYTVYVNPYTVLNSGGYTKHFYIEGQRIVSKLGGGWGNNGQGPLKAGNGKVNYNSKTQQVSDGIVKNLKFLGADGQILTAGKSGKVPPGQVKGTGNVAEAFRYFFHPDHLGSTSYVTDAAGEVYQHLEYFAFGETFVDEHSNTNRTPYLFNGKELDEETGLYMYGKRFYDPRVSIFYGVDAMAEKFPHLSPYNYANNNPTTNIDLYGLQGMHYMEVLNNGTKRHVIEKNVIVLTQAQKAIPPGATPKQIGRINRQNARIAANNAARVQSVREELNIYFNGSEGQTTNSKKELVRFLFNVRGMEVQNTNSLGTSSEARAVAMQNGITGGQPVFPGGADQTSPAAIITTQPTNQSSTDGISIKVDDTAGATAHEVGHTLMTRGQSKEESAAGSGGLMVDPPSSIKRDEVDKMIQDAIKKKEN